MRSSTVRLSITWIVGSFTFRLGFLFSIEWMSLIPCRHLKKLWFKLRINTVWFPREKKYQRGFGIRPQRRQALIYQLFTVQLHCHPSALIFFHNNILLVIDNSIPNGNFSFPSVQPVFLLGFRNAWSGLIWGTQSFSLTDRSDSLIIWDAFLINRRKNKSPFWHNTWWNECG